MKSPNFLFPMPRFIITISKKKNPLIQPTISMGVLNDISTQLFYRPEYTSADFSGKTIIVTGSNVGLGKETVKHFVRLKAKKIIMAVHLIVK